MGRCVRTANDQCKAVIHSNIYGQTTSGILWVKHLMFVIMKNDLEKKKRQQLFSSALLSISRNISWIIAEKQEQEKLLQHVVNISLLLLMNDRVEYPIITFLWLMQVNWGEKCFLFVCFVFDVWKLNYATGKTKEKNCQAKPVSHKFELLTQTCDY